MMEWANKVRDNKSRLGISICGISSVGPALYAVTGDPDSAMRFLEDLGLTVEVAEFWNDRFHVLELE